MAEENASVARSAAVQGCMHYSIGEANIDHLLRMFPDGEADDLNFVLFSTSGVHGSYATIEDAETDDDSGEVTFLIVHPRTVTLKYGNAPVTRENVEFLKKLRASSHAVMARIGLPCA